LPPVYDGILRLAENPERNRYLGTLTSEDPDGDGITWEYSGTSGIHIDTGGRVTVADPSKFNYEAYADHKFSIEVYASDGNLRTATTLTFELEDVAEAPIDVRLINHNPNPINEKRSP
jgi:hypothetical protein